ncbi:MAG: PIN domain-containing protein [Acidobacteriota bacterium]|nr:PIN domain-containing protein [Acidobacteriota bacterium]
MLLDTSVLVAGLLGRHADHLRASTWLLDVKSGKIEAVVSAHTLAEVYAVLTRLPKPQSSSPATAWQLIEHNILNFVQIIPLTGDEYVDLIRQLSQIGIAGGATYDAVIACAAAKAQVDHIVTFNARDFRRVYPSLAASVIVP